MSSKRSTRKKKSAASTPVIDKPPGYQPTIGRKILMLCLCIVGLIITWGYYFYAIHHPEPPIKRPAATSVSTHP